MGKWALVQCNCQNREPLQHSRWGAYACGHKDGAITAFAPNDLVGYGQDLGRIYKHEPKMFEIWRRIGDWHNYHDEYLSLSPDEATMWQLEIEQLQNFLSGREFMGWNEVQLWKRIREHERQVYARSHHSPKQTEAVLALGLKLCRASAEMNQPIEFFW
jgi:hypothetical protein